MIVVRVLGAVLLCGLALRCSLFEPREPEPPTQSSFDFRPPTVPGIVITNLQSAVAQKNVANYISCFADPSRTSREFSFEPSADASALYPSVLRNWTFEDEQSYFQNLVAKATPNGFSNLLLIPKDSIITADSVIFSFDYTFTFDHTEAGFPSTARGTLQFSLGAENSFWMIYRWSDFKTTDDITWSSFKGKFSN
ncbi:MAG: hypothetical protein HY708_01250 [Ignavibacteriae bacterium]|nr:hypothetical protein [Ignavibacteriota bacterium]